MTVGHLFYGVLHLRCVMPKLNEEKKKLIEKLIKDKVFEEAQTLLAIDRVANFTMTELAENIGVSKGTLYNYFEDKFDVLLYVYERTKEDLAERIKKYFREHPGEYEENLRYLFRECMKERRNGSFLDGLQVVLHYEAVKSGKIGKLDLPVYKPIILKHRDFFMDFYEEGTKAGVFKEYIPKELATFVSTYILGAYAYGFLRSEKLYEMESVKRALPNIEDMLVSAVCKNKK